MFLATLLTFLAIANEYVSPSPQLDALEAARFYQSSFSSLPFASFIDPCDSFLFAGPTSGRSNAAD
jgi:hypothetical protein